MKDVRRCQFSFLSSEAANGENYNIQLYKISAAFLSKCETTYEIYKIIVNATMRM